MKIIVQIFLMLISTLAARAAIHTETVDYNQGDTALEG